MTDEGPARYTAEEWAKFQEMQKALNADATREQQSAPTDAPQTTKPVIYWANLFSVRLWVYSVVVGLILGYLCSLFLPDRLAGWLV